MQHCHFKWPCEASRGLCDSWASCLKYTKPESLSVSLISSWRTCISNDLLIRQQRPDVSSPHIECRPERPVLTADVLQTQLICSTVSAAAGVYCNKPFMTLNGLLCDDVAFRKYSLTCSVTSKSVVTEWYINFMFCCAFCSFPSDTLLRQQWVVKVRRLDKRDRLWQPSKSLVICSQHFHEDDFLCHFGWKTVKHGALPTIFSFAPAAKQRKVPKSRSKSAENARSPSIATAASSTECEINASQNSDTALNVFKCYIRTAWKALRSCKNPIKLWGKS